MKFLRPALFALVGFFATNAAASDLRVLVGMGVEVGGDNLLEVEFVSGESSTIAAGDGLHIYGGIAVPVNESVDAAFTVGWKAKTITATNGDVSLSRFPLDAIAYYHTDTHRFGAGLTHHAAISLTGSGVMSDLDATLESGLGGLVSYDYSPSKNFSIGVKYESLSYTATDYDTTFDASSFGLYIAAMF